MGVLVVDHDRFEDAAHPRGAPTSVKRTSGLLVTRSMSGGAEGSAPVMRAGADLLGDVDGEGPEPGDDACERAYRQCFTFCSLWRGSEVPQPALLRPFA
jgi:hypothetical protein